MYYQLLAIIVSIWSNVSVQDESATTWMGFERTDFLLKERACILVAPKKAAKGRPWIWRTEFFGHEPQGDSMLLVKGYHVAYIDVQNMYGAPKAIQLMDTLYQYLVNEKHLHHKPVLEGFSRGGLFAMNWAATYPDRTGCLYLDAPVCDFKGWPGNQGKGPGSAEDWERLKSAYGFTSDSAALAYTFNPVDNLKPLAAFHIPILSVCGTADEVVPMDEHSLLLQKRYKAMGGYMEIISKEGVGHHPHSLKDPQPIIDFILRHSIH
ncbi:alpha/beta hydrolase family protein [Flavihumibacter petaseus]|uniref:Peptidase S9 prolyl oligopeptidase catalytic domain-containing protein n=1 Tax=Flavihumibacter petaseus NBRC 106054 TaxID=1220578 RepID=A0A0E9MZ40_9BACT|nr:alpha/beta hydrolase [Flavihumibacter petaseus]GAO43002.1 hypothetical protein FPE01S_02_01070 [Flavihumibacter petaseus NBRC 106054]